MPSILEGMPTKAQLDQMQWASAAMLQDLLDSPELPAPSRQMIELMGEGLSQADILGITKEERDAVFTKGVWQLQQGDIAGGRNTLSVLYRLEPTDERVIYALATSFQAQEDYVTAGRLYLHFMAFDATNPQGYLRVAECFIGNGEITEARELLEGAKIQAAGTPTQAEVDTYADSLLASLAARGTA